MAQRAPSVATRRGAAELSADFVRAELARELSENSARGRHPSMWLAVTALAAAAAFEPPAPRRGAGPAANPVLSRRALLPALATGSAALLAASAAQPASAGTGAAGAAVISVPDLLRITAEEWLSLPTDKALSRIGSLTEDRVVSIAEQLEEGQG